MKKSVRLKEYAKNHGIKYITAFRWFHAGKISGAFKSQTGSLFVEIDDNIPDNKIVDRVVIYCRVSNQSRKAEMQFQVNRCKDFCAARGFVVDKIYCEIASGMNDNRKKLWEMLDSNPTKIIIENKDRLTRFGFKYLENLLEKQGCSVIVMNPDANDEQDLMKDLVSIITSFCCRLYGMRRAKNKANKIKAILSEKAND